MRIYQTDEGGVWYFEFQHQGKRYHRSTGEENERKARKIADAFYVDLLRGGNGISERKPTPTLKQFREEFLTHVRAEMSETPKSVTFYTYCYDSILRYEPLLKARLNEIDEPLIQRFTVWSLARPCDRAEKRLVSIATCNRWRATLKKALRMAQRRGLIQSVPPIPRLKGEKERNFIFTPEILKKYETLAPEPLRSMIQMGCEIGICEAELIHLLKSDVHMETKADDWGHYGYIHIAKGKTTFRRRNLPITGNVRQILTRWIPKSKSDLVFTGSDDRAPLSNFHLIHQQAAMRKLLRLPDDAVFHSSRHTALTNLGLAGADIFSLQQAAGHANLSTTKKYVHPVQESTSIAFQKKVNREAKKVRKAARNKKSNL